MDGQLVQLEVLPTKGIKYPEETEIYIKPLSIKEQIDMDRYGISQAEYYQKVLDGITVKGIFNKHDLYFHDVQFLDLVRRLYTFDLKEEICAKNYPCIYRDCEGAVDYSFTFDQISFTEIAAESFDKEYIFSDGLEVVTGPLTIKEFISMCKKYVSNKSVVNESDIYIAYFVYCIKEAKDRVFENREACNKFLFDYIGNLVKNSDRKILDEIELNTSSNVEPFEVVCPSCKRITEVKIEPSTRFQQ